MKRCFKCGAVLDNPHHLRGLSVLMACRACAGDGDAPVQLGCMGGW